MVSPEIKMIIREFKLPDLKRVVEIEETSFDDPYPPNILRDIFNLGAGFLVAQHDNIILGYIIFWIRFEDEGHIISLAVDKDYRRQNVGKKLVEMVTEIFKKFDMKNIKLEVRAENIGAIDFYRSTGFKEEKLIPGYYEDGEDAVVMNLPLNDSAA
jgi:[ribosomal protein S18]-alanine N-acetyltransferase